MNNWKLLTGCFAGSVIKEGTVLDVPFSELDDDLQLRIRDWADNHLVSFDDNERWSKPGYTGEKSLTLDEVKELYEFSWEAEETQEPVDLKPLSQWNVYA
jgi:hypothetical protein